MDFNLPRHIRQTDKGLQYELSSRVDKFGVVFFASFGLGSVIWAILDTKLSWALLLTSSLHFYLLWRLWPVLGRSLSFTRDELLVERWGKLMCSVRWDEVSMICAVPSAFSTKHVFKNQEGKSLGEVISPVGPSSGEWESVVAAFLPDDMVWRTPGRINRVGSRKGSAVRSALGFVFGGFFLYWGWPSIETYKGDEPAAKLSAGLILGSLVAIGYGLLYLFEFFGHKRASAMEPWIDCRPYESGSALVDFVRIAVGIRPSNPRVYSYRARAKSYDSVRDARLMWLMVGGVAVFLGGLLVLIVGDPLAAKVSSGWQGAAVLVILAAGAMRALIIFSLRYLRQMRDLGEGLSDLIEFSPLGMFIRNQGATEVIACTWPKQHANMADLQTGLNRSRIRIDLPGGTRWYDLTAMERSD